MNIWKSKQPFDSKILPQHAAKSQEKTSIFTKSSHFPKTTIHRLKQPFTDAKVDISSELDYNLPNPLEFFGLAPIRKFFLDRQDFTSAKKFPKTSIRNLSIDPR